MDSVRKSALVTGVLFIVTFITSIPALALYGPVLNDAHYVLGAGAEDVVGIVEDGAVKGQRGDRGDKGDDEEDAGDERALSDRVHAGLLGTYVVPSMQESPGGLSAGFQSAVGDGQALIFEAWS